MKSLRSFLYIICGLVSLFMFYMVNYATGNYNVDPLLADQPIRETNGNPGLIFLVLSPCFVFFLMMTTIFFKKFLMKMKPSLLIITSIFSMFLVISSGIYTYVKAKVRQLEIFEINKIIDPTIDDPPCLWSLFSNDIFMNPLTFSMCIFLCLFFACLWIFVVNYNGVKSE